MGPKTKPHLATEKPPPSSYFLNGKKMKTARRRDQVRDWPRARSLCISLLAWIAELRFPDSFSLSLFVLPPKSFGRLGFRFGAVSTSSVGSQALLPVPTRSHVAYRTGSSYHFFISSCFYSFFFLFCSSLFFPDFLRPALFLGLHRPVYLGLPFSFLSLPL